LTLESQEGKAKALVFFTSRYCNTEKISRSLTSGLEEAGIETVCANAANVPADSLRQYDLICVGAPTEKLTASQPIKEFLGKLRAIDLSGKFGFAFDTNFHLLLSGSAAKHIKKELERQGLQIIAPRESAVVFIPKGGKECDVRLKEGEEKRFEDAGRHVGLLLAGGR